MADNRDWLDFTNLGLSVCTLIATVAIAVIVQNAGDKADHVKDVASHYATCIDNQFKLGEALCHDNNCAAASPGRVSQLTYFYKQVKQYCEKPDKDLHIAVSEYLDASLQHVGATATKETSVEARADVAQAGGVKADISVEPLSTEIEPASAATKENKFSKTDPLLYVQISSQDQKAAATKLITSVTGLPFMGGTLRALGPDPHYVAVKVTQIRCSKDSDCAHAQDLALYLGQALGHPVAVVDLSAKYGEKMAKFGPRFELWIAPGEFSVTAPGDAVR